ncbi:hypothetical protein HY640_04990 [Candidatus Woesearchaeota archaeon]|nr:hypothetical protein [Candidatus Woesearchaeota archaeon]
MQGEEITTGVDRLVSVIEKRKRISISDAAAELSVPGVVVEEWAEFLKDQGVIDIEYKFTRPFLVKKEFTKEELVKRSKDFESRKDIFIRQVQSAINYVEKESLGLSSLREEFKRLGSELEGEVKKVRADLSVLEDYNEMKRGVDQEISKQQQEFRKQMEFVEQKILEKQKEYDELVEHIKGQELLLDEEMGKAQLMRKNEEILKERLRKIEEARKLMEEQVAREEGNVNKLKASLEEMKILSEKVRKGIDLRKNELAPMMEQSRQHQKKIEEMQSGIIDKIVQKNRDIGKTIEDTKRAKERFEQLFDQKAKIDLLMDKIDADMNKLKYELAGLVSQARIIALVKKGKSDKSIAELEKKFREAEGKKKGFEKDVFMLKRLISFGKPKAGKTK